MERGYWTSVLDKRLSRRRMLAATSAGAAGAALLAACGGSSGGSQSAEEAASNLTKPTDTSKQVVKGGTILDSRTVDISSFDPHNTQSGGSNAGTVNYYHQTDALFLRVAPGYMEPASWEITGDLAQSWEWSPDGLKLTMKRRPFGWAPMPANLNPYLTSGRPITMDDVKWTMDRFFKEGSNRSDYLNSLNPAAPVDNITYVDDTTMVWNLKFPLPSLLSIMASTFKQSYLMPVEAEKYDIRKTPACCGAFYLDDYEPSVKFHLKKNPNSWMADRVYVDAIDLPIITEYAQGIAQFKTGNLYRYTPLRKEDILPTKGDLPQLLMYNTDVARQSNAWSPGYRPGDKTPFRDERLRQAYSMSMDRDTWVDVFYNVAAFESAGYPVTARWNTCITADWDGYWLDPQDTSAFGDNAKYYEHNIAEAKKLISAAGFPNGFDSVVQYPPTIYGNDFVKMAEVMIGMAAEAGIRMQTHIANDTTEWPPLRDGRGNFDGSIYRAYGSSSQADPVENLVAEMLPFDGNLAFSGFDVDGNGTFSGDPTLTDMINKARQERDLDSKKQQTQEIQRYFAKHMYHVKHPGSAASLELVWPTIKNERVYQGGTFGDRDLWLDPNEQPQKRA